RHLQAPTYGELYEPIKESQVGSSAMPFKKNPIISERMCSLARYVSNFPRTAWENASQTIYERTLDDSANRRFIIPQSFLAVDEILTLYNKILDDIAVYPKAIEKNLQKFGTFSGTEAVLMKLVERGESRQEMHERLRQLSSEAWEEVLEGESNPLPELLKQDEIIGSKIESQEIDELLNPKNHIGNSEEKCKSFIKDHLEPVLSDYEDVEDMKSESRF
ncbi:MAG: adenylosuccinate lyase, partial [Candidatus Aenigmatarchaeota archaeon]